MSAIEADLDAGVFASWALERGWSDGLPCVPPTPQLVATYLESTSRPSAEVLATLLPSKVKCTVEAVAINAALAGAPPEAMGLLCAAVEAIADRDFNLAALNATTAPVVPALVINGPIRSDLDLPYAHGCMGGMPGASASIGRALRLVIRNVAGQRVGETSESVFGQPARVVGLVTAEWEEESPWPPLSERRGVAGSAVTAFGMMGTMNIVDMIAERASVLLEIIGKSVAYVGANSFLAGTGAQPGEVAIALNPVWANEIIARDIPSISDVQQIIWEQASLPIDQFPIDYRERLEEIGRVRVDGRVRLVNSPDDILVFVCGGRGSLHATALHGFGHSLAATAPIDG